MAPFWENTGDERKDGNKQSSKSNRALFKNDDSTSVKRRISKIIPFFNPGAASVTDPNCSFSFTSSIASTRSHGSSRRLRTLFRRLRRSPQKTNPGFGSIQIIGGPCSTRYDTFTGTSCGPDDDDDDDTLVTSNGLHKPRRNRVKKPCHTVDLNFVGEMREEHAPSTRTRRVLYFCLLLIFEVFIVALSANKTFSVRAAILSIFKSSRGVSSARKPFSKGIQDRFLNLSNGEDTSEDKSTIYTQFMLDPFVSFDESSYMESCPKELGLAGGDLTDKEFQQKIDDTLEWNGQDRFIDAHDFLSIIDDDFDQIEVG